MLDIALKTQAQIIDLWKFYVPATMVILGWIFARKQPWPWTQRIAIALVYLGFVIFNLFPLVESYKLLSTLVVNLKLVEVPSGFRQDAYNAIVTRLGLGKGWKILIAAHIVADIIVLYFILLFSGKKSESLKTE